MTTFIFKNISFEAPAQPRGPRGGPARGAALGDHGAGSAGGATGAERGRGAVARADGGEKKKN